MNFDHNQKRKSLSRIQGLDVLRGIAALTVVLSHYIPYWNKYLSPIPVLVPNQYGYYAVELFFVISGIVIFATLRKCKTTTQFLILRVSRLYPAYWASILIVTLVLYCFFQKPIWLTGLVANMTMFQEFIGFNNFDNVYWSLTVELAFYLNVAWLFALKWHKRIFSICTIWLVLACFWKLIQDPDINDERDTLALLFAFDYAYYFVIGIILYDTIVNGVSKNTYLMLVTATATAFFISGFEGFVASLVFMTLASLAIFNRMDFMINRITLWLGNISFSLYLIHRNLGYSILPELHKINMNPTYSIMITVMLSLFLATLLTNLVERPALKFFRSKIF